MEYTSNGIEETNKIATDFVSSLKQKEDGALVIGLSGELGTGKTTFMKAFAESLGVKETIQSPTFVIMKIYKLPESSFKHLVHIDAYRLESGEELLKLGWKELVEDKGNIICIEWPERLSGLLAPDIMIRFEHGEASKTDQNRENQRKINIT